ncbi:hypothetical protein B0H12DRAFT_1322242, partial [Mycena haematopus]
MNLLTIIILITTLLSKLEPNNAQDTCATTCQPAMANAINSVPNSTTCTNAISEQLAQCLGCEDGVDVYNNWLRSC